MVSSKRRNYSFLAIVLTFLYAVVPTGNFLSSEAAAQSDNLIRVDFSRRVFYPALKSKIGFARALSNKQIPESIPFMEKLRPAIFCSEIDFDDVEDPNYALEPYPISEKNGTLSVDGPNPWLFKIHNLLKEQKIKIMHQLIGAPKPYQPEIISRPAIHPTPTNIPGAAEAMKRWISGYKQSNPILWSIWNEPVHTLAGNKLQKAAGDMVSIYEAYFKAMDDVSTDDEFGMASFIVAGAEKKVGNQSFIEAVFDCFNNARKGDPRLKLDFITLNNFFGKRDFLLSTVRNAIGSNYNTAPIIFTQYAPHDPLSTGGGKAGDGNLVSATRYLSDLDDLLKEGDVEHVCFSFWVGGKKAFIWSRKNELIPTALYKALQLYMGIPMMRAYSTNSFSSGIHSMATVNYQKASVLLWNESDSGRNVNIEFGNLPKSIMDNNAKLSIDNMKGNLESFPKSQNSDSLPSSQIMISKTWDRKQTLFLDKNSITRITLEAFDIPDPLQRKGLKSSRFIRTFTYADRRMSGGTTKSSGSYGFYDAVRDVAYLGVSDAQGRAITGVSYEGVPERLFFNFKAFDLTEKQTNTEEIMGIRIDYMDGEVAMKSVLFHNSMFDDKRTRQLPWGKGGNTGDESVKTDKIGNGDSYSVDIDAHAPKPWLNSCRRAIISFWMESTGDQSQGEVYLSESQNESAALEKWVQYNSAAN